jgi:hypothetical protein
MRIGIDCRKIADYGIGTYIRGLLHALVEPAPPRVSISSTLRITSCRGCVLRTLSPSTI